VAAQPTRTHKITHHSAMPPHNHARHIYVDMWRATYPHSGHLFLFRGKRADYLKVLYYDGTGLCLFAKYLVSH
jgi:IS66 Orf2 like protein